MAAAGGDGPSPTLLAMLFINLALIAFLGTLTDTALLQDPKFSSPF
jgi:hypothetical protein